MLAPADAETHTSTESVEISVTIPQQLAVTSHPYAADTGESTTALFPPAGSVETSLVTSQPDQKCLVHVHETSAASDSDNAQGVVSAQQPYVLPTAPGGEHLDAIHVEVAANPECGRSPLIVIISAKP